jgi:hypothetical protein
MKKEFPAITIALLSSFIILSLLGCPAPNAPDTIPPQGSIVINNSDSYAVTASATLGITASDNDGAAVIKMMLSNSSDFSGASWETFSATRAWTLSTGEGTKTVYAKFKDASENESAVCSDTILLDSTLPGPPSVPDLATADDTGISSTDNITKNTTGLTFSGTGAEQGSTVKLYSGSSVLGTAPADLTGTWSLDINLSEGVYNLFARAADVAGNESPSSAVLVVTVDTTPPGVPKILKPVEGENTGANKRPVFTWTITADAVSYELQADDSSSFDSVNYDWIDLTGTSYTPISDMSASGSVPKGTRYYLRMRGVDSAGNLGSWSNSGLLKYVNVGRFDNDFNGDGYSDAIVGAYLYNSQQGRAYIYFGGSTMDNTADVTMTGEATSNYFGQSVASAGDVNGDGYSDAIVGAPNYNSNQGRVYIYLGGSSMDNTADVIMVGEAGSRFGQSVAVAGDVNGDGYSDAIVGGIQRAYIYFGGSPMNSTADVTMTGEGAMNGFGCSVASAGDTNGDGYGDAIVGDSIGRVYIYFGNSTMDSTADVTMTGEATGNDFGYSVASAGDVNGDGYSDAIVGAKSYNSSQGRVYIYFGGTTMNNAADITMTGEATSNQFGYSVASAGDVNRDGYCDVIVGAYYYNSGQGRAYIYFGGSTMDNTADVTMTGEATNDYFGRGVASAGDVNGDGYSDEIAGANGYNSRQGRAYVYLGGSTMNNIADVTMTGEATSNEFGYSVASTGDRNGDGYCDAAAIGHHEAILSGTDWKKALAAS